MTPLHRLVPQGLDKSLLMQNPLFVPSPFHFVSEPQETSSQWGHRSGPGKGNTRRRPWPPQPQQAMTSSQRHFNS